jgi:hypothetical protein
MQISGDLLTQILFSLKIRLFLPGFPDLSCFSYISAIRSPNQLSVMARSPLIVFCLLLSIVLQGQFSYDFETDGPPVSELFDGQTDHFTLESGQLHLLAPAAGSSLIHTRTNIPDSMEMGIRLMMDFSPSASNLLRIYLQIDTFALDRASGYYIEIGENGAEDRIRFIRMLNGESLVLAEGNPGEFGEGPIDCTLRVRRDQNGFWQLELKHAEEEFYRQDLELFDSTVKRYFDQYVAIECIYTSTRADKFHFDDLYLSEIVPDTLSPRVESVELLDNHTMVMRFDEILDQVSARMAENYRCLELGTHPATVQFNPFKPNRVVLDFAVPFESTQLYRLEIRNVADLRGNTIRESQVVPFHYGVSPKQYPGLVINEVLFDPVPDGTDFLELYNDSGHILRLEGLQICNQARPECTIIGEEAWDLFPGEYLLLCPDTTGLFPYQLPDTLLFFPHDLPAFNNDDGNVSLRMEGVLLDSFDYDVSMHFPLISDPEGISLERISPNLDTCDPSNWHSASGVVGGATPGRENSQYRRVDTLASTGFYLQDPVFSPDNDGFQDQLIIRYEMPGEGYVGTVVVFDLAGHYVCRVVNNQLLGISGIITWDGLGEAGNYQPLGPFILLCTGFNESGLRFRTRLVAYLAGR